MKTKSQHSKKALSLVQKEQIAKVKSFYQAAIKSGKSGFKKSLTQIVKETGCNPKLVSIFKKLYTSEGKLGAGLPAASNDVALKLLSELSNFKRHKMDIKINPTVDSDISLKDDIFDDKINTIINYKSIKDLCNYLYNVDKKKFQQFNTFCNTLLNHKELTDYLQSCTIQSSLGLNLSNLAIYINNLACRSGDIILKSIEYNPKDNNPCVVTVQVDKFCTSLDINNSILAPYFSNVKEKTRFNSYEKYKKEANTVINNIATGVSNRFGLSTHVVGLENVDDVAKEKDINKNIKDIDILKSAISSEFSSNENTVINGNATSQSLENIKQSQIEKEAQLNLKKIKKSDLYAEILSLGKEYNLVCTDIGTTEDIIVIEKNEYIKQKLRELADLTIELNKTKADLIETKISLSNSQKEVSKVLSRNLLDRILNKN